MTVSPKKITKAQSIIDIDYGRQISEKNLLQRMKTIVEKKVAN